MRRASSGFSARLARSLGAVALVPALTVSLPGTAAHAQGQARAAQPSDIAPGFRSSYAEVNGGVRLHYVRGGAGQPVLLIPGWPQTWYVWRHVMPRLAEAGYDVIVPDTRGMGGSSRPAAGYDMATVGADLHDLMARHLGHQRYAVVGHDIGMWIGYAMAADRPEAVERVALIDAVIPGIAPSPPMFMPQFDNRLLWHFMFNQLPDLPEALVTGREATYLGWLFDTYAYRAGEVARDEYLRAYSPPGSMLAGFSYYRAIPETIAQNRERARKRLAIPVLALGGEFGTGSLPRETMIPVAAQVSGEVLRGCGHYVPEECPADLLALLLPFLAQR